MKSIYANIQIIGDEKSSKHLLWIVVKEKGAKHASNTTPTEL